MRSKLIGLLAALFLVCGCARKIITTDQIEDIEAELERADKDTLVVFDCDDVLITGPAHTKVLVSEKMPKLVDNLQQRGVQTVILTAYSINAS
ncbi:MAG: DUF2608 domain-containing protein, partial [Holosporales bacterium]|nr:DUF2608 domain-containing protein [Holosporales bacterium]